MRQTTLNRTILKMLSKVFFLSSVCHSEETVLAKGPLSLYLPSIAALKNIESAGARTLCRAIVSLLNNRRASRAIIRTLL